MVSFNELIIGLRVTSGDSEPLVSEFLEAAHHFVRLLSEVDIAISSNRTRTINWVLKHLSKESPALLLTEPGLREDQEDNRRAILDSTLQGLEVLRESDNRPRYFSDQALTSARGLVRVLGDRVHSVEVFSESHNVVCDESIATNVRSILRPGHNLIGTIEGHLEAMNSHSGFQFSIYEPVLGTRIACEVALDATKDLRAQIIDLYESRVQASGILRTNAKGDVRSAQIQEIKGLRREPMLSGPEDIAGLYDITAGVEAEEYVRKMRDA